MKVENFKTDLICTIDKEKIMTDLFLIRNVVIDKSAPIAIVEKGCKIPSNKLAIIFEWDKVEILFYNLEKIGGLIKGNSYHMRNSIMGRLENENYERIKYEEICFLEAKNGIVCCITPLGEYKIKEKLYEMEDKLPKDIFIRISRSYIVNINNVREINPWFGRRLVLKFDSINQEVEVSKNYVKSFKCFLGI